MHPAVQFRAPAAIETGVPLKTILDPALVRLIGASFAAVYPPFNRRRFARRANAGLDDLELVQRSKHIAAALADELPPSFAAAQPILLAALGPPLNETADNGLAVFFYYPHSHYIAARGPDDLALALEACHALTRRFTAEFCIRPLLIANTPTVLKTLRRWVRDPDPHVRRLVSEGTRPRLPWAGRLPMFIEDPSPMLPLLDRLAVDSSLYVRRSVANHIGDIAKDHLDLALDRCRQWLDRAGSLSAERSAELRWVIRHALRHPDKKGYAAARELRLQAG